MALSNELISQFAKATKPESTDAPKETIVYGTAVDYGGKMYARLDGSDRLTPIITTTGIKAGDRVTVVIKNHSAIITGNITSPSAGKDDVDGVKDKVDEIGNQITEFEIVIADKVSVKEFDAQVGRIDELVSDNVLIKGELEANKADIKDLKAENVTITGDLTAANAEIEVLKTTKLDASIAEITYATIENLDVLDAYIHNLEADYGEFKDLTTDKFTAVDAEIKKLDVEKLSATEADLKYANIDFANIGKAAIENFFSKSGMIGDLVVGDGTITGTLVGVTIKGDLIEGGTVKADKLVVQGEDGLYYKLNVSAEKVSGEQTEYNSLSGSIITAKSITAEKISVKDLVAFSATIGGFKITDHSLYSGVKESAGNTTRGVFLGDDGQFAVGDSSNYLKFFKDTDGSYKLAISASAIKFGTSGKGVEDTIVSTVEEFYQSTSPTELKGGKWSETTPLWKDGTFIWRRTLVTHADGTTEYTPTANGVCISGNTGATGEPGTDGTSVTIKSTSVTYQAASSGTTVPTGQWTTAIPTVSAGQYLWTKTVVNYSDGKSTTSYSVGRMGQNGAPGADGGDGKGIKSTAITYQAGTSQTTAPTSTWTTSIPKLTTALPYLWTRTVVTYTDNTTTTSYSVSSTLDGFEIGGRNLLLKSDTAYSNDKYPIATYEMTEKMAAGETYTIRLWGELGEGKTSFQAYLDGGAINMAKLADNGDGTYSSTFTGKAGTNDMSKIYIYPILSTVSATSSITKIKLEKGNKATDWTPAPEDMATSDEVKNAQDTANTAKDTAESTEGRVTVTEASIQILQDSIRSLVTDENGSSMMTQNGSGWTFNIGAITDSIEKAAEELNELSGTVSEHDSTIKNVNELASEIAEKTAYITMTTDETGAPCIELGKSDNNFKVRITNTSIDFLDGGAKIAYISNQALYIERSVIKNALQIGEGTGFIFRKRANGNMGLQWVGEEDE